MVDIVEKLLISNIMVSMGALMIWRMARSDKVLGFFDSSVYSIVAGAIYYFSLWDNDMKELHVITYVIILSSLLFVVVFKFLDLEDDKGYKFLTVAIKMLVAILLFGMLLLGYHIYTNFW